MGYRSHVTSRGQDDKTIRVRGFDITYVRRSMVRNTKEIASAAAADGIMMRRGHGKAAMYMKMILAHGRDSSG